MDEQLELELKFGKRSVARGLGPGEQPAEIPVDRLMEVDIPDAPADRNMPLGFINEDVVSSFFLLREIEASLMLTKSVHFNTQDSTITVWLPASKNDPRALTSIEAAAAYSC